ncbi:MAG: DUF3368 domain-containing protein [Calditrichaeota bacterium]|nr:DUF3368 domain-containing protein [Calditrichota bacterium]
MIVVTNTTPIISLASIQKTEILKRLFSEIIIPQAVYDEIKAKESYGYKEVESDFIKVQQIKGQLYKDLLLNQLDNGEAETILLAKELDADLVIIDENIAYKIAQNSDLKVTRTLSILLKAKEMGIIKRVKPLLDEMISKGRWYSPRVYNGFLKKIGEL